MPDNAIIPATAETLEEIRGKLAGLYDLTLESDDSELVLRAQETLAALWTDVQAMSAALAAKQAEADAYQDQRNKLASDLAYLRRNADEKVREIVTYEIAQRLGISEESAGRFLETLTGHGAVEVSPYYLEDLAEVAEDLSYWIQREYDDLAEGDDFE